MQPLYARLMILTSERWLFVCSANYVRSPTAEYVARRSGLIASSCGTDPDPLGMPISEAAVKWARRVICMEEEHARVVRKFGPRETVVWHLPDDWQEPYDAGLIRVIEQKLHDTFKLLLKGPDALTDSAGLRLL